MDLARFAFSTGCFTNVPLSRALAQISAAGFSKVQIRADAPHLWLDRTSPADVTSLRRQLEKSGLSVVGIDATRGRGFWSDASPEPIFEPSLISSDRRLREWRIAYIKKALRLAKELGADNVTVASGRMLHGMTPKAAQKLLDEGLLRLLEYAEGLNLSIAMSCEPALLIQSNGDTLSLLKRIDAPRLTACVDIAVAETHRANFEPAISFAPIEAIRKMKRVTGFVRLADIQAGKYSRLAPGEGDLDFRAVFRAINSVDFIGPLIWDLDERVDAVEACRRTFKFVKQLKK